MTWLKTIATELFGLFVDSGVFAVCILIWLAVVGLATSRIAGFSAYAGVILFAGLAVLLLESTLRRARQ